MRRAMGIRPTNLKGVSDMGLTRIAVTVRKFGSEESYTSTFLVDTGTLDVMDGTVHEWFRPV